jgi:hypothetical protein
VASRSSQTDGEENVLVAETPLGVRVRVTRQLWQLIIDVKHPVMARHEHDLGETLRDPEQVRRSRSDPAVYLFYRRQRAGRWLCAVVKRLDGEGFLISAYPTDAIKEGEPLWSR